MAVLDHAAPRRRDDAGGREGAPDEARAPVETDGRVVARGDHQCHPPVLGHERVDGETERRAGVAASPQRHPRRDTGDVADVRRRPRVGGDGREGTVGSDGTRPPANARQTGARVRRGIHLRQQFGDRCGLRGVEPADVVGGAGHPCAPAGTGGRSPSSRTVDDLEPAHPVGECLDQRGRTDRTERRTGLGQHLADERTNLVGRSVHGQPVPARQVRRRDRDRVPASPRADPLPASCVRGEALGGPHQEPVAGTGVAELVDRGDLPKCMNILYSAIPCAQVRRRFLAPGHEVDAVS